jgi:hypothetical protein
MKTLKLALGLSVLAGSARADLPVGRGDVTLNLTTAATYDSNVFGTPNAQGDYYGTLTPQAVYVRQAGEIEARANVAVAFERYLDQTQLDAANLDADASLRVSPDPTRNFSGSLEAAYVETSDVNTDVDARIKAKTATFTGTSAWIAGPRTDFSFDASYSDIARDIASDQQLLGSELIFDYKDFLGGDTLRLTGDYDEARSSGRNLLGADLDQNSYSLAAGLGRAFYHDVIQAWVSCGYRVLERSQAETSAGVTRQGGPIFLASLTGPFLPRKYFPKVKSRLELSYEDATTPGVDDPGEKELTGALHLDWQARDTTAASFSATRSQRLSADDLTVVTSALQLGVQQTLRYNLTGNLSAGYNWDTFHGIGRSDQTVLFSAGLNYVFARNWNAQALCQLGSADSNVPQANYTRDIVTLSVAHQF